MKAWVKRHPFQFMMLAACAFVAFKVTAHFWDSDIKSALSFQNVVPDIFRPVSVLEASSSYRGNCAMHVYKINPQTLEKMKAEGAAFFASTESRTYATRGRGGLKAIPPWKPTPVLRRSDGLPVMTMGGSRCEEGLSRDLREKIRRGLYEEPGNYYTEWKGRPLALFPDLGIIVFEIN